MKSFIVGFHQEDNVDSMQIQKLNQQEFENATAGGTRQLFELDTNIGFFVFLMLLTLMGRFLIWFYNIKRIKRSQSAVILFS